MNCYDVAKIKSYNDISKHERLKMLSSPRHFTTAPIPLDPHLDVSNSAISKTKPETDVIR